MENLNTENNRAASYQQEEAYRRAERRLKDLKGFYGHAFAYVVVNIFLIVLIGTNTHGFWHFGTFATPIFWGIGLAIHALSVFGKNLVFGKSWEERKVKEFMEKDELESNKFK